jgi:hypothetical protein
LESRNDHQTATDRNQVLEHSNIEIWLATVPYEPSADLIAGETTNESADQSRARAPTKVKDRILGTWGNSQSGL